MAGNVDTRIVQMQFDNKSFERDIKTSEKSLDKFKEKLDFSKCEQSLEEFSKATKALSFDNIAVNLQKLADKFTGLGTVSELVLSQIRRGIESTARKVSNLVNSLGFEQITAGRSKFEEMNKNVQTIIGATGEAEEEVYRVMKRLNEYTDMTSYNFTDMASNIGKFTAVGIDLRDAEKQMEGIANWAARSGAGIQEASRAMYNLSQAMGVGKMTTIDWKSIENAGMATKEFKEQLIQAGLAVGTLKIDDKGVIKTASNLGKQMEVNYQNLRETLQKGWANRAVMEKTLLGYYYDDLYYSEDKIFDLTAEQLEKNKKLFDDNKLTFGEFVDLEGADQMSQEVKQKLIDIALEEGNLVKDTDKNGKTIYKTADKYGKQVEVSLTKFQDSLSSGWLDKNIAGKAGLIEGLAESSYKAAQKCLTLTDVFNAWKDQLSTGWMKAWEKIFGQLSESMELFSTICDKVGESFSKFIKVLVGDGENALGILGHWEALGGRNSLWSLFVGEYDGMYEGAYGFLDILHDIGEMISRGLWEMIRVINADEITLGTDEWYENADYRTWFLGQKLKEGTDKIRNFVQGIRDWFNEVPEGDTISRGKKIQNFVNGLFSIVSIVYTGITDIFHFVEGLFDENHLGPAITAIINVLEALGLSIRDTGENAAKGSGLKKLFDQLLVTLQPLTAALSNVITKLSEVFVKVFGANREGQTTSKIWDGIIFIINKLADIIGKVGEPILNFIGSLIEIVSDLFTNGINSDSLKNAGIKLADALGDLFGGIFGIFPGISEGIEKFFAYIFGFAEDDAADQAYGSGKSIIKVIKSWLRKIFGGTAEFVGDFKDELGNVSLFSIIKENLGIGLLGKFIGGLSGIVKGTNMYALIMSFLGGYSLIKLIKVLKQGGGLIKTVKGFFGGLGDVLKGKLFKIKLDSQTESFGDKLWKIAKAIGVIVAAVVVLGMLPLKRLAQGIIALAVIAGILVGLMAVMKIVAKDLKQVMSLIGVLIAMGIAVFSISIGIAFLILALKSISNMNLQQTMNMITGLFGILTVIALFATYVKSLKISGVFSIAILAIGIAILVLALKPLAKIDLVGLAKMIIGLYAILYVLREFATGLTSMKGSGMGSLVMVAISIWILLEALKPLATYEWGQLAKIGVGLIVLLDVIASFTKNVSYMKKSGMGSLILVAASIWILLEAVKPLANYEWEQLGKMGAGLIVLMIVLTKFTKACESMHSTGMVNLILVAASLWILVQALMPLAQFEWGDLAKMAAGLIVLGIVVVLLTKLITPIGLIHGAGLAIMFLGLALIIAAFGLVMGSIQNASWGNILAACGGLIAIIVVFAIIVAAVSAIPLAGLKSIIPMFLMMLALSVMMIAFSFAMNEIKKVSAGKIIAFAAGLSALMIVFAIVIAAVSAIPLALALKGILVLTIGLTAIFGVISLLAPMLIHSVGSALTDLAGQLSLVSSVIGVFSDRMANVDESGIDRGEDILGRIKNLVVGLGEYVGFKASIDDFSNALYSLGTSFESFSWHMNRTGELKGGDAISFIKDLAACANDLDTITKLNIDTLTTKITGLGGAMMLYARGAKEVALSDESIDLTEDDVPDVTAAIALMKAITSGLADENGIVIPENMPDEESFGTFGAQLSALAGALILFEEAGQGIGAGFKNGKQVLDYFKQLKDHLDETKFVESYNEVTGTFTKEKVDTDSLGEFGRNIEALGSSLKKFSEDTTFIDEETGEIKPLNFDSAIETLSAFARLENKLPNVDGLWQLIAGRHKTLGELGGELELFGQAMNNLSKNVTGVNDEGVQNFDPMALSIVTTAVDTMVSILTTLDTDLGRVPGLFESIWQNLTGHDYSLKDLGDQMKDLGVGLKSFGQALSEGGWDQDLGADNALSALDSILDILIKLTEIKEKFQGTEAYIRTLGDFLVAFGSTYYPGADEDLTISKMIVQFMKNIDTAFNEVGDIDESKIALFKTMAEALNYLSDINPETDWEMIGKNIAEGVKSGIESGTSGVIQAAVAMATASYKAVKDALEIKSPSKVTEDVGKNEAEGMARGIEEGTPAVKKAANDAIQNPFSEVEVDKEDIQYTSVDPNDLVAFQLMQQEVAQLKGEVTIELDGDQEALDTLEAIAETEGQEQKVNYKVGLTTDPQSSDLLDTIENLTGIDGSELTKDIQVVKNLNGNYDDVPFDRSGPSGQNGFFNASESSSTANTIASINYTASIEAVKNEVACLRDDLKLLSDAMSKFKMYVYPDALVGAIGSEMDEYLGEQGYRSVRTDIP